MTLPARLAPVLTGLILTGIMTFVVAGVSTFVASGSVAEWVSHWPPAWGLSWAVAFPTILVVMPRVRRLVGRITSAG